MATDAVNAARCAHACGPVRVELAAPDATWLARLESVLALYDAPWPQPHRLLTVECACHAGAPPAVAGRYLQCARYRVDQQSGALIAASLSGTWCRLDPARWSAQVVAPRPIQDDLVREDVEQFLVMFLTVAWRSLGWTPLHVGSAARDGCCALFCTPAGGGKSTLVASLVRRGWRTLGDDKLLARRAADAGPVVAALSHGMNVDPHASRWFPEFAGVERLPPYSRWSAKRKVQLHDLWPGCTLERARPTHVVLVRREEKAQGIRVDGLSRPGIMEALVRQVAIPSDAAAAGLILGTLSGIAATVQGLHAAIGPDAYADPSAVAVLEEALT